MHRLVKQGETRRRIRPVSVLKDWSSHFHGQKFATKISVGRGGGNNALLPIKGGEGGGMRGCRCGMKACRCSGRIILSEPPKKESERDVPQTYIHRAQTDSAGERPKTQQENEKRSKRRERERVWCWLAEEVHLLACYPLHLLACYPLHLMSCNVSTLMYCLYCHEKSLLSCIVCTVMQYLSLWLSVLVSALP